MAIAFFEVAEPRKKKKVEKIARNKKPSQKKTDEQRKKKYEQLVAEFIQRFDRNQDGQVDVDEVPLATQRYGRYRDHDGDGIIGKEDLWKR